MTTSQSDPNFAGIHTDDTPPMSAPTYRACACGWSINGSSDSVAVEKFQKHLAKAAPEEN